MLLRFPAKPLTQIIEEENKEVVKRMLAVERLLDGCSKESLGYFNTMVEFEELDWQATVCKRGEVPTKVWVVYKGSLAAVHSKVHQVCKNKLPLQLDKTQFTSRIVKILAPEVCLGLYESRYRKPMKYDILAYESGTIIFWIDSVVLWKTAEKELSFAKMLKLKALKYAKTLTRGIKTVSNYDLGSSSSKVEVNQVTSNSNNAHDEITKPKKNSIRELATAEGLENANSRGLKMLENIFGLRRQALILNTTVSKPIDETGNLQETFSRGDLTWFNNLSRR